VLALARKAVRGDPTWSPSPWRSRLAATNDQHLGLLGALALAPRNLD